MEELRRRLDKMKRKGPPKIEDATERELAAFYLQRMDDLQAFFQVAQLALETVLGEKASLDFEEITKIDIG